MDRPSRRRVLATTGAALAAGLAGCTGDGGDGGGDGGGTDGGGGGDGGGGSQLQVPSEAQSRVENYLTSDPAADNYDSITTMGGMSSATVEVGAEGNGGNFAFAPAAIAVETGTTVNWEWVAGSHNVKAAEDSDFDLDSGSAEQNGSYEFTFDQAGVANYYCTPHQGIGMKGSVVAVTSGN